MAAEKHSFIRRALEKNIRDGQYFERIPPVRALAREFGVSLQTMTKALRPLVQSGLLLPGPGGTRIARSIPYRFPIGVVTLVLPGQPECALEQDPLITTLREEMTRDDITPVLLVLPSAEIYQKQLFWEARQTDGYLFLYQSFFPALQHFDLRGIPCLAGNRLDNGDSGVHWIDFDWRKQIFDLVRLLLDRGFRRIAYLTLQLSAAAKFHYETWLDVCESYGIGNYTPEESDFALAPEERLKRFAASAAGRPEALIFFNLAPALLRHKLAERVWHGVTLVTDRRFEESVPEYAKQLHYSASPYRKLAKEMWRLFKSIADGTAGPPRGHWVQSDPMRLLDPSEQIQTTTMTP